MDSQPARVIAVVSEHWIIGALPSSGVRVQDLLDDTRTEFFRLNDVQICAHGERETCLKSLSQIVIAKSKIEFVIMPESRHEAPAKRCDNFMPKSTANIYIIAGKYRIQGTVHLPKLHQEAFYTLTNQVGRFFPITQASLSGSGVKPLTAPVVVANKDSVNCFYIGEPATDDVVPELQPADCVA